MRALLTAFARNTVFANILLAIFFMAGGMATVSMVREAFPEFSLEAVLITVAYPGADPEEVEEGISRKIEEAIETVDGIKQYNTTSSEGVSTAWLEIDEDYEASDVLDKVRSKVDAISTFPVDAERPIINEFLHPPAGATDDAPHILLGGIQPVVLNRMPKGILVIPHHARPSATEVTETSANHHPRR